MQQHKPHLILRIFLYLAFFFSFATLAYFALTFLYFISSIFGGILAPLGLLLMLPTIFFILMAPILSKIALSYFVNEKNLFIESIGKAIKELVNFFWLRLSIIFEAALEPVSHKEFKITDTSNSSDDNTKTSNSP